MAKNLNKLVGVATRRAHGASASSLVRRIELKRISKRLAAAAVMMTLVAQVSAFGKEGDGATADPFAAATAAAKDAAAKQAGGANPFRAGTAGRYAAAPTGAPATGDARARSDQFLLDARRALSVGDTPRAQQFLSQAQQLKATYDGPGDSPQKVAESIRECQELAALRNSNGALWKSSYSKFLVKQADLLLSWNDLDTATRAANEASQLNPEYPLGGVTPQDVLRRVAERRKNPSSVTIAGQAPAVGSPANAKTQTLLLLSQARMALAAGNLPEAQALAGKASALNVPDSQFAPQEDRPAKLALDLQKAAVEGNAVQLAASALPATATPAAGDYAEAATGPDMGAAMRVAQAPDFTPLPLPTEGGTADAAPLPTSQAAQMLEAGEQALRSGDREGALESFRAAYDNRQQLDVLSQQRLQGHMQMLSSNDGKEKLPAPGGDLLESAADGQSVAARQLSADIFKRQSEAIKIRETESI